MVELVLDHYFLQSLSMYLIPQSHLDLIIIPSSSIPKLTVLRCAQDTVASYYLPSSSRWVKGSRFRALSIKIPLRRDNSPRVIVGSSTYIEQC